MTNSKKLFAIFIIAFLNTIAAGQTFFKYPNCGNAKRYIGHMGDTKLKSNFLPLTFGILFSFSAGTATARRQFLDQTFLALFGWTQWRTVLLLSFGAGTATAKLTFPDLAFKI